MKTSTSWSSTNNPWLGKPRYGSDNPMYGRNRKGKCPGVAERNRRMRGEKSSTWRGGTTKIIEKRIATKEWRQLRKKIKERDNHQCVKCGKKDLILHCHHIIPERITPLHEEYNLMTVCRSCHSGLDHGAHWLWDLNPEGEHLFNGGVLK